MLHVRTADNVWIGTDIAIWRHIGVLVMSTSSKIAIKVCLRPEVMVIQINLKKSKSMKFKMHQIKT